MAGKMKANVYYEPEVMKFEEIDIPQIGDNEVLVKVKAVGICGSDISYYYGHSPVGTPDGKGPIVLGHEISGVVEKVGSIPQKMGLLKPGDRVVVNPVMQCNACPACANGQFNVCANPTVPGVSCNGGFAEYVKAFYTHVYKIGGNVSFEDAALAEPLACAAYAVKQLDIQLGQTVVVFGPGGIGMMMVQLCKSLGAGKVILVGRRDYPLNKGKEVGADAVVNIADKASPYYAADLAKRVREVNGGNLAERCLVPTSNMDALQDALLVTGARSTIVYFGLPGPEDTLKINALEAINSDRTIKFSWLAPLVWDNVLRAISSGQVKLSPIVTHTFPLEKAEEGIKFMKTSKEDKVKGLVLVD